MIDERFFHYHGPHALGSLLGGTSARAPEGSALDIEIAHAVPIDHAGGAGTLTYFDGRNAKSALSECAAEACLVSEKNAQYLSGSGTLPILSKEPRADFARILSRFYSSQDYNSDALARTGAMIAPSAQISDGAEISPGVYIGPGVIIGRNARIGAHSVITHAVIGDNFSAKAGAIIGGAGFGVANSARGTVDIPQIGIVRIGDNVSVGSHSCIDRAMFGETKIGSGCKFDNLVQIGHNCVIGDNCMFAAHAGISGSCTIGNNVVCGGRAGTADHLTIGDGAMLAANAGLMHDVPAGEVWSGIPAQPIRQHMKEIARIRKMVRAPRK